ncbi:hypothetical protein AB0C96_42625 [Streptomyces sp. NPDC048506]|uniref:hypothetical protein n=1 Tax=Streptomyces sp. NPDC048506 TaxID=3155028 RepID=UPI003438CC86
MSTIKGQHPQALDPPLTTPVVALGQQRLQHRPPTISRIQLVEFGVAESRIEVISKGKTEPIASETSAAVHRENRHVVIDDGNDQQPRAR